MRQRSGRGRAVPSFNACVSACAQERVLAEYRARGSGSVAANLTGRRDDVVEWFLERHNLLQNTMKKPTYKLVCCGGARTGL